MLRFSLLVCLAAAASLAQPPEPTRPLFSGTFYGEYDAFMRYVDHYGAHEQYGTGWRAYYSAGLRGVRNSTFETGPGGKFESYYHLERYDMNIVYDVMGNGPYAKCTHFEVTGPFPDYWNWLEYAEYVGMKTVPMPGGREKEVEIWFLEVGDERYELGVDPDIPNQPAVYFRQSARDDWLLAEFYTAYESIIPDESLFLIPLSCQQQEQQTRPLVRQPLHQHH